MMKLTLASSFVFALSSAAAIAAMPMPIAPVTPMGAFIELLVPSDEATPDADPKTEDETAPAPGFGAKCADGSVYDEHADDCIPANEPDIGH